MAIALDWARRDVNLLKPAGFRQNVYSLLLATLAINILSLALPVMTRQIYNRILPNPETGTLSILIAGVCVAVILEAVLRLCRAYVIGRAGAAYEHRMACTAMSKTLNADLSKMTSYGIGEHLNRMGSISRLKDFYNGYSLTVWLELAFVPLFLGLIVYIAQTLAVVPVLLLLAFIGTSLWSGYRLRKTLQNREKVDNNRFNFLIESLEGVHTIKSFGLEKFFERRYEALEEDSTLANYRVTQETADTFNSGAIFSHLMVAGVISVGAWLVLNGTLTTGSLIATLLLSGRMMQPVQKALALWARYQDYTLAKDHVKNMFSTPQHMIIKREEDVVSVPDGQLHLSHISFQYKDSDQSILEDIDLDLQHGEVILVSGMHGSGKTTLMNIISGIYPPTGGNVYIGEENVNSCSPDEMIHHVGFIRTRPMIFRGTIRDNITCFGQTNDSSAREVAALLNVDKDVAKLPGGFDTFLNGNNTDSISQGLKQRISMARVLATKPHLILFDNADRALDKDGYVLVYSLLAHLKGKVSIILVTDDRNLSALADRHYTIEDGHLRANSEGHGKSNIYPYRDLMP